MSDNPLDKLFVRPDDRIEALKVQGWNVLKMGGDWIVRTPENVPERVWLGPGPYQVWLFDTEEIAWEALIKSGAL